MDFWRPAARRSRSPGPARSVRRDPIRSLHRGKVTHYGELEGDVIYPLDGSVLGSRKRRGGKVNLADVTLRYPVKSPKVFAVGLNYKSHIGNRPAPTRPEIFYKPTTALQDPFGPIIVPPGSKDLHYEAEFVIVMGKRAGRVSEADAASYISATPAATTSPSATGRTVRSTTTKTCSGGGARAATPSRRWGLPSPSVWTTTPRRSSCA